MTNINRCDALKLMGTAAFGLISSQNAGALHKIQGKLELISIMTPAQAGDIRFV